jgi:hypothetical protein
MAGTAGTSPKEDTMDRIRTSSVCAVVALLLGAPPTAVAQSEAESVAPVTFSARFQPGPSSRDAEVASEERPDGVRVSDYRGGCWHPTVAQTSDPRLDGTLTYCLDENRYYLEDASYAVKTGTFRIETDDGAWQGARPITEWTDLATGDKLAMGDVAILAGEGDYDGLYAVMTFLPDWSDIRGVIVSDPPPAAPSPTSLDQ